MPLTRDFKETIRARVERDPKFRKELLREGLESMLNGDIESAKTILRDYINAGYIPGPHMQVSGPPLSITGGHCDENLLPFEWHAQSEGVADGIEAVQRKTREIIKYGADLIKICATGGVLSHGDNPQASQFTLEEMRGSTFTISNLGTFGIKEFSAIINPPSVAILAVAAAEKRPVVREDKIVARTVMSLTLSADHRAVDGATAAEFLRTLKGLLEEPGLMLV